MREAVIIMINGSKISVHHYIAIKRWTEILLCTCISVSQSLRSLRRIQSLLKNHSLGNRHFQRPRQGEQNWEGVRKKLMQRKQNWEGMRNLRSRRRGWDEQRKCLHSILDILPNAPKHATLPWGVNCHIRTNGNFITFFWQVPSIGLIESAKNK